MRPENFASLGEDERRLLRQEIDHAIAVNFAWMQRLRRSVRLQTSWGLQDIAKAECCEVYRCLRNTTKPIGSSVFYSQVQRAHRAFHEACTKTMALISAGHSALAFEHLQPGGLTQQASERLCDLLKSWRDML